MQINGVEVRVGQTWRTRGGQEARITAIRASGLYPVEAHVVSDGVGRRGLYTYTAAGRWSDRPDNDTPQDLIDLISQPVDMSRGGPDAGISETTEPLPAAALPDSHEATTFGPLPEITGEWVLWAGAGTPPVAATAEVMYRMRSFGLTDGEGPAPVTILRWNHTGQDSDIVAYKVVGGMSKPEIDPRFPEAHFGNDLHPASIDPGRTNPKDAVGDKKLALHLLSPIAEAHWVVGQYAGMLKYGAWNWRAAGVRASIYISALRRHLAGYQSGEEFDPVDGSHHLGNIMACAAILLEAREIGKLVDDRPPSFSHRPTYAWAEDRMAQLKVQYSDKTPRHYNIGDTAEVGGSLPDFERKKAADTEGGAA